MRVNIWYGKESGSSGGSTNSNVGCNVGGSSNVRGFGHLVRIFVVNRVGLKYHAKTRGMNRLGSLFSKLNIAFLKY
jgi:hypothetical protein